MKVTNPPIASDLMATARSFGNYDLAAALSDIIDNSIQAAASQVEIDFQYFDNDVIVRIRDNGSGMDGETLKRAMRPASSNPGTARDPKDLGRFGWGMKSASLSQARILTVVAWQSSNFVAARWNIDDITDWSMDFFEGGEAVSLLDRPPKSDSGTEVIWTNSDRLKESADSVDADELSTVVAMARKKLSLVFHRFLSGEAGTKLSITINGTEVNPVDPFVTSHNATQTLDAETIQMTGGRNILIKPFILPHFSKLDVVQQAEVGGEEGMIRNQGFYIYRNKRLIIHGTWFRLIPHGELSQLTRVRVDLPNNLDEEWKITLDKSDAQLPSALKSRLLKVIKKFSKKSVSVHRRKGVSTHIDNVEKVWCREVKNGQVIYKVNREHPLTRSVIGQDGVEAVLAMLETYFPADDLVKDSAKGVTQGPSDPCQFEYLTKQFFFKYLNDSNEEERSLENFIAYIQRVEPFASQKAYASSYVKENLAIYLK
ncbi:ATP-binding protein [Salinimonas marina]|uniref:ATP-binding protein n=1 Tax=Salinimonas marina TaxID=2785918 RepID=A0A7S9HDB1_9ALTE|nr:ATP-binding protein [Salinimonas marina]QPG05737.1 ATP-binding protein [Salinimonas marina]